MGLTNLHAKLIAVLLLVTLGASAQTTVIPDKLRIKTVPQSPVSGDMMVTVDASGNIKKDTIKSGSTTTHSLSFAYGFLGQPFSFNGSTPITSMVDTTKLQTILNFFPKGDTRYAKIGGGTLTNTLTFGTGLVSGSFNNSANVTEKVDTTTIQTIANFFPKGDTRYYKSSNPSSYISRTGISATAPITYNNSTGVIGITQATTSTDGYLSSTDWNTFNGKQGAITLTTTGSSGAATLVGNTLNIPQYSGATYTAGAGLTLTTGAFSVNTSQNISTLSNLTTNGLVKTSGGTGALSIATAGTDYQAPITGTGFVKSTAGTISYDNSTYLTTSAASSTYLPLAGGTLTGTLTAQSLVPDADGTRSLGTSSFKWGSVNAIAVTGTTVAATNTIALGTDGTGNHNITFHGGGAGNTGTVSFGAPGTGTITSYSFNLPTGPASNTTSVLTWGGSGLPLTWTDLSTYASLASPAFTGTPTVPTQATSDSSLNAASTEYVKKNFQATVTYFTPGMFSGAGTSASKYNWGTATIPNSALVNSTISGIGLGSNLAALTNGGGIASFTYNGGSAINVAIDYTQTPTWTGAHIFQNNTITTTATTGVLLNNGTVSISGTSQLLSPALSFRAHHWTGSADAYTDVMFYNEADSYGTYLTAGYSLNGGSVTKVFQVSQYGDLGAFGTSSSGSIQMSKTTMTTTSSDGLILTSAANTATSGVPVRYSPAERFTSMVWNTSGTPASNQLDFKIENRPVSSASPTGALYWSSRLSPSGTGAYTDLMSLDNLSNLALLNTVSTKHLIGSSGTPTIAAGAGAGTSPTVSVTGNDIDGVISVTTGTAPSGSNAIVSTITFNTAYGSAPRVVLVPGNRNTQALVSGVQVLVPVSGQTNGVTTTTFVIESGATALAASTAYIWTYQVFQ